MPQAKIRHGKGIRVAQRSHTDIGCGPWTYSWKSQEVRARAFPVGAAIKNQPFLKHGTCEGLQGGDPAAGETKPLEVSLRDHVR